VFERGTGRYKVYPRAARSSEGVDPIVVNPRVGAKTTRP
jgi:hypothetical protein